MSKALVLGVGNTLRGDDGVGVRVAEELKKENLKAEVMNGANLGFSLLDIIRDHQKVIIVDAVDMGQPAGSISSFQGENLISLLEDRKFSLHEMGILEVLKVGYQLQEDLSKVTVVGVQPKSLDSIEKLSPEVENKISEVIAWVKKEVE